MIGQLLAERYLVVKKLGSGGFSETYLARDKHLPQHPLCVVKYFKLSSSSTISPDTAQRLFDTEARILDQLGQQYDQIPTLFAYCHQQNQTYQVQECIDGDNLGSWIARKRRLSSKGAIALLSSLLPILDEIHAHQIIHRDIKPSNLIQRKRDGKVVLIDFGAAFVDDCSAEADTLAIGTLGYMPDEQQAGKASSSSDIYALGVSLIHLLTGVAPKDLQYDAITGELGWQHLGEAIDPKLVAILDRMVHRHARDRYASAAEVLTALEALPASTVQPVQQWEGWSVPAWQQSIGQWAAQANQQVRKPAAIALLLLTLAGGGYLLDRNLQVKLLFAQIEALTHRSNVQLTLLRDLPMQTAIDQMLIAPNNQVLVTAGADRVVRLWSLPNGSLLKALSGNTTTTALSMSHDSRLLVSGSDDRIVRLWDVASGKLLRQFRGSEAVTALAVSPDGETIASGSKDGSLRLWNLHTGALLQTFTPDTEVTALTYAAPNRLISANSGRQLQVWDLTSGQLRRTFAGHTDAIVGLQIVSDHTLLSFGNDRTLVWDLQREELVRVFSEDTAQPVAAFLDSQRMMTVYDNGSLQVRTRRTGWLATTVPSRWHNLETAAVSSNHRYLVGWSSDHRLRLWKIAAL